MINVLAARSSALRPRPPRAAAAGPAYGAVAADGTRNGRETSARPHIQRARNGPATLPPPPPLFLLLL
eukprot:scaffold10026_cov62-Phaeocystis_antarctica.AAC.7